MKKSTQTAAKARQHLDARLGALRAQRQALARPNQGWIRAIRRALGMTAAQLGHRMGITQASVSGLEASEMNGSIRLATLQRAAEAMHCMVVYALVPHEALEAMVMKQANKVAASRLQPVEHTMLLENQALTDTEREAFLKSYIRDELDLSTLWR